MKDTYLHRLVEAFLKDEYELESVNFELTLVSANGDKKNVFKLFGDNNATP